MFKGKYKQYEKQYELENIIKNDMSLICYSHNSNKYDVTMEDIELYNLDKTIKNELYKLLDGLIPVPAITQNTYNFYNYIFNKYNIYIDKEDYNKFNDYLISCKKQLNK